LPTAPGLARAEKILHACARDGSLLGRAERHAVSAATSSNRAVTIAFFFFEEPL